MGIRKRILLIVFCTAILTAGVLYGATSLFLLNNYQALEREEIQRNLQRVEEALGKDIQYLDNASADWAYWTDTYEYLRNKKPEYAEVNLNTSTLIFLDLDILLITDSSFQPVSYLALHPLLRIPIPPAEDILRLVEAGSALPGSIDQSRSGILMTSQGPLMISARYILTSDLNGPPAGVLVFGRYLNDQTIQEVSGAAKVGVKLMPLAVLNSPADFQTALSGLKSSQDHVIQIIGGHEIDASSRIAVYTLLEDVAGEPILILRVDDERRTFQQGKNTINTFAILLALSALITGLTVYFLLDRFFNKRLLSIHQDVNLIRRTRDFSLRVSSDGEDELSGLAAEINQMMSELSQYQAELVKSDNQFREVLHNLQLVSVIIDTTGVITFCNDFFLQLTGWKRAEVLGTNWFEQFIPADLRGEYQQLFETILGEDDANSHLESHIITRGGEKRLIAWNNTKLRNSEGAVTSIARIGEDITERRIAEEKLRLSLEETRLHLSRLTALRQIDTAITSNSQVQEKMQAILTTVQESLKVDAVSILLAEDNHSAVTLAATQGSFLEKYRFETLHGLDELLSRLRQTPHPMVFTDLSHASRPRWLHERLNGSTAYTIYAVAPLVASGSLIGIIEIFSSQNVPPDEEWVTHLQTLALQTAIAVDSAAMIQRIESAKNELAVAYEATLVGLAKALELRDRDTKGHSERMMELAEILGKRLGMDETALRDLKRGTLLHDIGKMGVPDHILHKPGPLSEEEWTIMRMHPQFAYDLLHDIPYLASALEVPYCHHERWDGKGYPRGLRGEEIPLSARIFSVIDVWDALTHSRPYRPAWTLESALEYIQAQAGAQFDPQVVTHFMAILEEQPSLSCAIYGD